MGKFCHSTEGLQTILEFEASVNQLQLHLHVILPRFDRTLTLFIGHKQLWYFNGSIQCGNIITRIITKLHVFLWLREISSFIHDHSIWKLIARDWTTGILTVSSVESYWSCDCCLAIAVLHWQTDPIMIWYMWYTDQPTNQSDHSGHVVHWPTNQSDHNGHVTCWSNNKSDHNDHVLVFTKTHLALYPHCSLKNDRLCT